MKSFLAAGLFSTFLMSAWLGYVLAAGVPQAPRPIPAPASPNPPGYDPCATGETPCDPNRPWMRGNVEKYCARKPSDLERMRKERPLQADRILACECQHVCDPFDEHAGATMDRAWDGKCQTRCNPANCQCPNPCES